MLASVVSSTRTRAHIFISTPTSPFLCSNLAYLCACRRVQEKQFLPFHQNVEAVCKCVHFCFSRQLKGMNPLGTAYFNIAKHLGFVSFITYCFCRCKKIHIISRKMFFTENVFTKLIQKKWRQHTVPYKVKRKTVSKVHFLFRILSHFINMFLIAT